MNPNSSRLFLLTMLTACGGPGPTEDEEGDSGPEEHEGCAAHQAAQHDCDPDSVPYGRDPAYVAELCGEYVMDSPSARTARTAWTRAVAARP